jgi:hypothetical protein
MRRDLCNDWFPTYQKRLSWVYLSHFVFKVGFFLITMPWQLQKRREESNLGSGQWEETFEMSQIVTDQSKMTVLSLSHFVFKVGSFISTIITPAIREVRAVKSRFMPMRRDLWNESNCSWPIGKDYIVCITLFCLQWWFLLRFWPMRRDLWNESNCSRPIGKDFLVWITFFCQHCWILRLHCVMPASRKGREIKFSSSSSLWEATFVMSPLVPPPIRNDLLRFVLLCFPSMFLPLPYSHAKPVTKEFRTSHQWIPSIERKPK